MSCFWRKRDTTSGPNVKLTPLSFSLHPVISLSGSDHNRSQRRPQSGIYWEAASQHVLKSAAIWKSKSPSERSNSKATHISRAHDAADLLHGVQIGTQTTVHGEDLLVNDSSNGETVEAVGEGLPKLDVVSTLALVVETVDTVDGSTLVVAAQNEEVLGILDLVGQQQADCF